MNAIDITKQPERGQGPEQEPEDFGPGARGDALRQFVEMVGRAVAAADPRDIGKGVVKALTRYIKAGLGQPGDADRLYVLVARALDTVGGLDEATILPILERLDQMANAAGLGAEAGGAGADDERVKRPDGLPHLFFVKRDGIYFQPDPKKPEIHVCSPIVVRALARDGAGMDWSMTIAVQTLDGSWNVGTLPKALLADGSGELRATLLRMGAWLAVDSAAVNALKLLMSEWSPAARATTHERLGWTDADCTAFVLGDGNVIGEGVHVYAAAVPHSLAAEMKVLGTLEGWKAAVAAPAKGNGVLVLAISLALTGPLLDPAGVDGFGLHLRGPSSRGKTTALRVATSVWGSPKFLQTWRATSNGLEGAAAAANSACMILDELGQVDGREAGALAYMLANGSGKARATRSGAARPPATWKTAFLSSGELSLASKMAEAKAVMKAGQAVRCIDVPATTRRYGAFDTVDGMAPGEFADRMNKAAGSEYGSAGRAFVRHIIDAGRVKIRAGVARHMDDFRTLAGLEGVDGQVVRVADRFALVSAAGELASEAGITGWPKGAALGAALEAFEDWVKPHGTGSSEVASVTDAVRSHLLLHRNRFQRLSILDDATRDTLKIAPAEDCAFLEDQVRNGETHGWMDREFFYINTAAWGLIIAPLGIEAKDAARYLRDAGFLVPGDGKHMGTKMPRNIDGRPRAYRVKMEILDAGGSDEG